MNIILNTLIFYLVFIKIFIKAVKRLCDEALAYSVGYNLSAMDWMQFTIKTNKDQADFISEVLMGLDALSIIFSDSFDDAIFEPPVSKTSYMARYDGQRFV
ncbi:hypothetical protein HUE58_04480 [Candidatus Ruthia endofausta]|uniref:Uncharacterized protein n=1 Tax=Candidatus Ruthia endofausta TaxID=2738852 RepID=A0A6N0HPZ5_9GAMM|nr:hypothetical protein [Candidatus Ruthia endofausta]QKQ24387.1 hypothetical protein HUE58_04480 [Candidatus Ruthia endofausta]